MSQQAIEQAAAQALAPVAAALLEDLHAAASAEITRLEASMPARIDAAEQDIQNWATDAIGAYHRLAARIDEARAGAPATVTTPAAPAAPAPSNTPPRADK